MLVGLLVAAIVPLALSPFLLHVAIMVGLFAYLGSAWNLGCGYTGQLSWGHAAFMGLGAYASTALYMTYRITPWLGTLVGMLIAAGFGAVVGAICFRLGLKGHYFVIATIALAEIVRVTFINWADLGGAWGLLMPVVGDSLYEFQFHSTRVPYYYIVLAMLVGMLSLKWKIANSKLGYYFTAIKDDEEMAEALGVDTFRYKLIAMTISAALTALGGTFYAQYVMYISPDTVMAVHVSTDILMGPVVGGMGTLFGPLLGAAIVQPIMELTRAYVGGRGLDYVVAGLLTVGVALMRPSGVIGLFRRPFEALSQLPLENRRKG
jgi:branched-chain amino acid transport system permease protein